MLSCLWKSTINSILWKCGCIKGISFFMLKLLCRVTGSVLFWQSTLQDCSQLVSLKQVGLVIFLFFFFYRMQGQYHCSGRRVRSKELGAEDRLLLELLPSFFCSFFIYLHQYPSICIPCCLGAMDDFIWEKLLHQGGECRPDEGMKRWWALLISSCG